MGRTKCQYGTQGLCRLESMRTVIRQEWTGDLCGRRRQAAESIIGVSPGTRQNRGWEVEVTAGKTIIPRHL